MRVIVDQAPAYELLVSLQAFAARSERRVLDLGPRWAERVRRQVPAAVPQGLAALGKSRVDLPMTHLIWQCPGRREAADFIAWLAGLSAGELYERSAPYARPDTPLPPDLAGFRDGVVAVLTAWHETYFRHLDPAILSGLAADGAAKQALLVTLPPLALVELATGGIVLEPGPEPPQVLLVPQYHFRPFNLYGGAPGWLTYQYPVDALPPAPGEPPPALVRRTGAVADPSRLRILHFLGAGPRSFTEVVQHTGLAKSTVNHHMVALRSAGLVRVHVAGDHEEKGNVRYSLRPAALAELSGLLSRYLTGE